jgi:pimeloyl-ACP methyl ester carboxylesterase
MAVLTLHAVELTSLGMASVGMASIGMASIWWKPRKQGWIPALLVFGICLALLWPRPTTFTRSPAGDISGPVIVQLRFPGTAPLPSSVIPARWKALTLDLESIGTWEETRVALRHELETLAGQTDRLVLVAEGPATWLAVDTLLDGLPVERVVLIGASSGPACGNTDVSHFGWGLRQRLKAVNLTSRLTAIDKPLLFLMGDADPRTLARCQDELARRLTGAHVEIIPRSGPDVAHDAPGELAARLAAFLF